MKNLHIENSYKIWNTQKMRYIIFAECNKEYNVIDVQDCMNRSYNSMFIEWYLHNIGYWVTLPFIKNEKIKSFNERFKHVDLEEH